MEQVTKPVEGQYDGQEMAAALGSPPVSEQNGRCNHGHIRQLVSYRHSPPIQRQERQMKRFLVIAVVIIAIVIPAMTWAQEEGLTLEGLAEQVTGLVERVKALERMLSPSAVVDSDGNCVLAVGNTQFSDANWDGGMHNSTLLSYTTLSDGKVPKQIMIRSVKLLPDGQVAIELMTYQDKGGDSSFSEYDAYVTEYWNGCEFQSHSPFWEEDHRGNITILE